MAGQNPVPKLYKSVVDDVISNVRESFLDEGVDEQVLTELKQLWESKLLQSKAVEGMQPEQDKLLKLYAEQQGAAAGYVQQQHATAQAAPATTVQHTVQQVPAQLPVYNATTGTLEMSGAAQAATLALPAGLYQQQLAALQGLQGGTITLQAGGQGGTQYIIQTPQGQQLLQAAQPQAGGSAQPGFTIAAQMAPGQQPSTIPRHVTQLDGPPESRSARKKHAKSRPVVQQLDGPHGPHESSSEDDDDDDDDKDDEDEAEEQNEEEFPGEEEEPLNSGDDVSDQDPNEQFDTENVVVCQFDKINRNKNKWKFHLKDGIMNLNGKDYVFQKGNGEAEW